MATANKNKNNININERLIVITANTSVHDKWISSITDPVSGNFHTASRLENSKAASELLDWYLFYQCSQVFAFRLEDGCAGLLVPSSCLGFRPRAQTSACPTRP